MNEGSRVHKSLLAIRVCDISMESCRIGNAYKMSTILLSATEM